MVHEYKYDKSDLEYFSVRYTPKFQKSIDVENHCCDGRMEDIYNRYDSVRFFENYCSGHNVTLTYNTSVFEPVPDQSDIILLITFNHNPSAHNIEIIQHFYKDHFRNIIFCGNKQISRLLNENRGKFKRFDSFTFIDMNDMDRGYYHYYCMSKAIEINFNIKSGILLMSDDVFLKFWNLNSLDKRKIWFAEKIQIGRDTKKWSPLFKMLWEKEAPKFIDLFQFINEVNENKPISKNPGMKNYPGK